MTQEEKWKLIVDLDEELLQGAVILSEWSTFLARDAETAFTAGANLAAIICAIAAVESHLRYEPVGSSGQDSLFELLDGAELEEDLKAELDLLRRLRNRWIHVKNPEDDAELLSMPEQVESELEQWALRAIRAMLRVLCSSPWV